jgi:hypothetical protein
MGIEGEYSKNDLAHYSWVPCNITAALPPSSEFNKPWPTLGEMIDKRECLVTFVNSLTPDKANAPYVLGQDDFVWESAYAITSSTDFACTLNRPSNTTTVAEAHASVRLFLIDHILYWQQAFGIQTPGRRVLAGTSSWDDYGGLGRQLTKCASEYHR